MTHPNLNGRPHWGVGDLRVGDFGVGDSGVGIFPQWVWVIYSAEYESSFREISFRSVLHGI